MSPAIAVTHDFCKSLYDVLVMHGMEHGMEKKKKKAIEPMLNSINC